MIRVFLSYSHPDSEIVRQIATVLDEAGIEHFLDRKDIGWGDAITESVQEALHSCTHLLVVISPASLKSQWVPFEIGHALATGKRVLPMLTHPSLDAPDYLRGLKYIASIEAAREFFLDPSLRQPSARPKPAAGEVGRHRVLDKGSIFKLGAAIYAFGLGVHAGVSEPFAPRAQADFDNLYAEVGISQPEGPIGPQLFFATFKALPSDLDRDCLRLGALLSGIAGMVAALIENPDNTELHATGRPQLSESLSEVPSFLRRIGLNDRMEPELQNLQIRTGETFESYYKRFESFQDTLIGLLRQLA